MVELSEILECEDLKQLVIKYGNEHELRGYFESGIDFAPDKLTFIENRISSYSDHIIKYSSKFQTRDKDFYEIGIYKRLGFEWVNNGYNAQNKDFKTLTYNNLTVNSLISKEHLKVAYFNILREIAMGATLAFHIAYLKEQLRLHQHKVAKPQNEVKDIPESTITIAAYAILHVYLSKFGEGSAVTRTNCDSIAHQYGFTSKTSGRQLFLDFQKFKNDSSRLNLHTDNKKSDKTHILRFESIIPHLEKFPKSYRAFQEEFNRIKALFNKHY